jgi:exodeoxyribonuclease V alpha subunit
MNLEEQTPQTLEGALDRIVYASEENAWSVVRVAVPGRREPVTAVGNLLGVQPGESIRLHGHWIHDPRYGEQFRVESYVTVEPATLVGIERYLGSGLVPGIGKVMAKRLVERFGLDTLEVIETKPARLTEVEGIGAVRSERIRKAWREQRGIKEVMLFLQSHGVTTAHAVRIYREYAERAIAIVKEDPYRLAIDIFGIGFRTADRIAIDMGIPKDAPRRAQAGLLHLLGEFAGEGHLYVPAGTLSAAATEMLGVEPPIVEEAIAQLDSSGSVIVEPLPDRSDRAVYLKALHAAEAGAAGRLVDLVRAPARSVPIDVERALAWFENQERISLAPAQREAIRLALTEKLLVVTGGPGTGKTTLVRGIIRILERKRLRILLAAPTGRAAKRLSESTGRDARTIHRLLEFSPKTGAFERNGQHPLEADLVIIDEVSMVDQALAHNLLKAIPDPARLILVGDVDQLPSVGPGDFLREVIDASVGPVVRLETIFRQAEDSRIIVNAHRVNAGEMPLLGEEGDASDFYFIEREDPEEALATIMTLVTERIPRRFGLDPIDDVQVLTPMHRGALGTINMNAALQKLLNPAGEEIVRGARVFRAGDKVIQMRNNYDLEVFNGDIGRIVSIDDVEREMRVRFDERVVVYDAATLDELSLAYACSIHKSQGSEYPCVVMPIHTQHYVMLRRNLLYTGITRAKRLLVLVGTRKALAIAVRNRHVDERRTRLAERLRDGHFISR